MRGVGVLSAAIFLAAGSALAQTNLEKVEEKVLQRGEARESANGQPMAEEAELPPPAPGDAAIPAPSYLGVVAEDLAGGKGAKVAGVNEGSPADTAELKVGDVITAVNEAAVATVDDLEAALKGVPAGTKVKLTILRDGKETTREVTLGRRPSGRLNIGGPLGPAADARRGERVPSSSEEPAPAAAPAGPQGASLGITVAPLTDQWRSIYGITTRSGAVISAVRAGSPAARAGLPVGGVVVAVDGQRIDSSDQLVEVIRAAKPGDEVEITYYSGNKLTRKSVRLAPAAGASLIGPGYSRAADRPLPSRAEQAMESMTRPGGGADAASRASSTGLGRVMSLSMIDQLEALRERVKALEEKVAELEARLSKGSPAGEPGAAGTERPPPGAEPAPAAAPSGERPPILPPSPRDSAREKSSET
jgi:hypothetical protein